VKHINLTSLSRNLFFPFLTLVQRIDFGQDDLDEQEIISLLAEVIKKIKKENKELNVKRVHIQVIWLSAFRQNTNPVKNVFVSKLKQKEVEFFLFGFVLQFKCCVV